MNAKLPENEPKPTRKGGKGAAGKGAAGKGGAKAGKKAGDPAAGKRAARPAGATAAVDLRVTRIVACIDGFGPDRDQNLRDLAQVVGDIVGAQSVTFRVPRGDDYIITVGWKLG